mgnify:CR=1 FL=1
MKPISKVNDLRASTALMIKMMKDLDLIIRIVDTMQEREYLTDRRQIDEREEKLLWERGAYGKSVLADWLQHGEVKNHYEVSVRLSLMLKIPSNRFVAVVDDLAHVYERRYHELTHRCVMKQAERQERRKQELNQQFTKKKFNPLAVSAFA